LELRKRREVVDFFFFADQGAIASLSGRRFSGVALAVALAILLIINPLLAFLFFLIILPLLSLMTTKGKALAKDEEIYLGGRILLQTGKVLFLSFNASPRRDEETLYLSRGLKIPSRVPEAKLIELAINIVRRTARSKGRRKGKGIGRTIDFKVPKTKSFKVSIVPTLRRVAALGHWPQIHWEDLREPLTEGRERISIVMILDSSASMVHSMAKIVSALGAVKKEALRYRDRVSLIVCKGYGATIVQHPTTNFNLVIGKLSKIGMSDFTPLASGMYKGYLLALNEMRRGYTPVMIIISDGNVNVPMPRRLRSIQYCVDPAVQSVLEVAEVIAHSRISTVVINTKHEEVQYEVTRPSGEVIRLLTGTEVLMRIAEITKGSYVGLR